jgi:mRNA interferase RelE/StbE
MVPFDITFARSARKELERLDDPTRSRVFRRIERLASNPRPAGCRKLEGADDL